MVTNRLPTNRVIIIILACLILFPLLRPFIERGIPWTYDGDSHLFRMAHFHKAILEGQIPPRWASGLSWGFGTPVFLFNWSLPYWFAEPFLFLRATLTDAQKAVVVLMTVASFASMYAVLAAWFAPWAALAGATAYLWAPFRIYLLYTSGAMGMEAAFIWWPLLFLGLYYTHRRQYTRGLFVGGISFGLLMLSHQVFFLMIIPLWMACAAAFAFYKKSAFFLLHSVMTMVLGLMLSAYFWLPAVMEKSFINIDKTQTNVLKDFLPLRELLLQPGFHQLAGEGWWKHIYAIGWPQIGAAILGSIALFFLYRRHEHGKHQPVLLSLLALCLIFFVIGIVMMLRISTVFWQYAPLLSSFIYPLRFQALVVFTSSVLLTGAIHTFGRKQFIASLIAVLIILFFHANAIPREFRRTNWHDEYYQYGDATSDIFGEFLPRWVHRDFVSYFWHGEFVRRDPVRIQKGKVVLTAVSKKSDSVSFVADVSTPSELIINQFYFPGWRVTANGTVLPITITPVGEMKIFLIPGRYEVRAMFGATTIRTVGLLTTGVAILTVVGILLKGGALRFRRKPSRVARTAHMD